MNRLYSSPCKYSRVIPAETLETNATKVGRSIVLGEGHNIATEGKFILRYQEIYLGITRFRNGGSTCPIWAETATNTLTLRKANLKMMRRS